MDGPQAKVPSPLPSLPRTRLDTDHDAIPRAHATSTATIAFARPRCRATTETNFTSPPPTLAPPRMRSITSARKESRAKAAHAEMAERARSRARSPGASAPDAPANARERGRAATPARMHPLGMRRQSRSTRDATTRDAARSESPRKLGEGPRRTASDENATARAAPEASDLAGEGREGTSPRRDSIHAAARHAGLPSARPTGTQKMTARGTLPTTA